MHDVHHVVGSLVSKEVKVRPEQLADLSEVVLVQLGQVLICAVGRTGPTQPTTHTLNELPTELRRRNFVVPSTD